MTFNSKQEAQQLLTDLGIALANFDNLSIQEADEGSEIFIIMFTDKNGLPMVLEEEALP